jgi:hypothetical protein
MIRQDRFVHSRLAFVLAASMVAVSAGCRKTENTDPPALKVLSDAEAAAFWTSADSREPVGKATVRRIEIDNTVTVVCTQAYALRIRGGGRGGVMVACGGSCKLKPGGTFGTCKTSGCLSEGTSCSELNCSDGCELATQCKPENPIGLFAW